MSFLKALFGSRNQRVIKSLQRRADKINRLETKYRALKDDQLKSKTAYFKQQLAEGKTLDDILEDVFACVREAAVRVLEMRHFDVQLIGGMVLNMGKIAEMCTGEGKTLVATLAVYLNALEGKGVHLVTVNDYLAKRDGEQMGKLYEFLGMSVGIIVANMPPKERKKAYACDITYGTNNEFGFDYLRDNMAFSVEDQVQRPLNYAIIDEVDSILIDEARTPLIISGEAEGGGELYLKFNNLIPLLEECEEKPEFGALMDNKKVIGDYYLELKNKQAYLTDDGHQKVEDWMIKNKILAKGQSLYDSSNINLMHYFSASLRAHALYKKDVDYMVSDGKVHIVDEHTGRVMQGRRWSDGLHQAMEAKEGVEIQKESQTMASITYQNYFKLYDKLSGMTGTADTEAFEFNQTYDLEVVVLPTNKPLIRLDHPDIVFMTEGEKFTQIITEITESVKAKQPVLVGTATIDTSERLSKLLKDAKINHEVLNAKQHTREAHIIAQAGSPGQVTIATNMAGRGTDIVLGGSWQAEIDALEKPTDAKIKKIKDTWAKRHQQVLDAGGLKILGSERHESRRIDNQLRGRAGRQGDPGASRFYLSLDDTLIKIFASPRMISLMRRLNKDLNEPIESRMVTKSISKAQKIVEQHYFDMRKQLLEYDNVANEQRKVVYEKRNKLLSSDNAMDILQDFHKDVVTDLMNSYVPENSLFEMWDLTNFAEALQRDFAIGFNFDNYFKENPNSTEQELYEAILEIFISSHKQKRSLADEKSFNHYEKVVILHALDKSWREHLSQMDHLRSSIGLRGYAQKDPKQEYKKEAYLLFTKMLSHFKYEVISVLAKLQQEQITPKDVENQWKDEISDVNYTHDTISSIEDADANSDKGTEGEVKVSAAAAKSEDTKREPYVRNVPKVGRNDPCPCGSGKKYKVCHGKIVE